MKSRLRTTSGFTLIELVVTMSILSVILLMATQITESARSSIRISETKSNNDAISRRAFDLLSNDFQQMVVREDALIEFKPRRGNDEIKFFIKSDGLTSKTAVGDRPISLVSYLIEDGEAPDPLVPLLKRGTLGQDYANNRKPLVLNPSEDLPENNDFEFQTISKNIFRFETQYLYADNITSPGNPKIERSVNKPIPAILTDQKPTPNVLDQKNLRGITITIATLDDRSLNNLTPDRIAALADLFEDATDSKDTLEEWTKTLDTLTKPTPSTLPKETRQAIRCYQRNFLIP